jgi:hypothetical protein
MAKPDVVEFCHSIEGFHGPERALQLLARIGPHPSDNASQGDAGALASNNPMALVGDIRRGLFDCGSTPEFGR